LVKILKSNGECNENLGMADSAPRYFKVMRILFRCIFNLANLNSLVSGGAISESRFFWGGSETAAPVFKASSS